MKNFVTLLLLGLTATAFTAEAPMINPILTQDLAHTPRLFACMKALTADVNAQGFHGPFFPKNSAGKTDHATSVYIIRSPGRQKFYWYLRASPGTEFKLFSYETPNGTAIGMFGPTLERNSTITESVNGKLIASIDLTPCEAFLAKP